MSDLRPCPWNCKRAIEITRMIGSERYSLLHRCPVVGPISFTEETAEACVAAWNHLPVEDDLVKAIDDYRWAATFSPSCQKGVVENCRCLKCASERLDAALKMAKEGR
jgi:hypothetical protein